MKTLFYCGIHNLVNFNRIRPYYDLCYGFDANPDKIEQAEKFYQNDLNVKFIYGALMEKSGEEVEFTITTNWTAASSLGSPNPEFGHMKSGLLTAQKKIKVPTINLYDFCISNNIQEIDTLITDLQGIDLTVLKTLTELIQKGKIREIQCEVEPDDTPTRYLGIPPGKLKDFNQLLSKKYDALWIDPVTPSEDSWEMDVRWRVKGGHALDDIEFVLENELLVAKIGPNSSLATYSQYREDLVIDALFSHRRDGFYVDVGANDPDIFSNTKLFYGRGWRGINVEPEPNLHAGLCAKRDRDINLKVGVGPAPGTMTFYRMSADTLSSFNKQAALQAGKLYGATLVSEEPTPVVRLVDIFESHLGGITIDFMSVDAEGYDLAVLESNDWARFRPALIIVEINVGGDDIIKFLQQHDYILVFDNGTNGIFVSKEFCSTLDGRIREDLASLELKYNLRTVLPHAGGEKKLTINIVYGHLPQNDIKAFYRGNVSIIWSCFPIEGCDHYVYHNAFSYRGRLPGLNILLMLEPAVVLPGEFDEGIWKHFDHVFGLFDALIGRDNKFHKILFPRAGLKEEPVTDRQSQRELLYPLPCRKNAICMISGNKRSHVPGELYSKRIEVAEWFSKNSDIPFDVYGTPPFPLSNYRGAIPEGRKLSVQKQYRYNLCFENTNHPVLSAGYITEKILDCFETRTIPIYLGASNIEKYIPENCFIDFRQFDNLGELDKYLRCMSYKDYERHVAAIDAWVTGGNLRKYSSFPFYDSLAALCAAASSKSPEMLFAGDKTWTKGKAVPPTARNWKFISVPVMWTWKHLSKAKPPVPGNGKIINERLDSNARRPVDAAERDHKSFLIGKKPSIKVLAAGVKFSSGNARRGYDYGWWNIFNALHHFENVEVQFFDYATEAQQRGVAGMSDRLVEIVRQEQPDLLLYSPSDLQADILHESLKSITDHTDTQTIIWMNDDHLRFDDYALLWATCADHIITTSHKAAGKYHGAGFGPKIIKSQWAFNPFTYQPTPAPGARDVSFVGAGKGNRLELIEKIRQSGLPVDVFGAGWNEDSYIPFYDMVRIFNQSRINLNLGNSSAITTQPIRRRNFEVPGCHGFLVTTPVDNLEEYYEPDKEVVIASSLEELIDKSRYYLAHEGEREEIARRGYERTLAEHTWTHRLVDIFKHIGFNAVASPLPQVTPSPFVQLASSSSAGDLSADDAALPSIGREDSEKINASIIVGAYNQLQYTRKCVESILHYTEGPYELLLMDNGSTDGTFEYFESVSAFHPHTRVIRYYQNRVVEANANYVFSLARGKYCVGVCNDVLVHDGWLKNFITQIESAPDIGIVGPRSNNVSGPQAMQSGYDTLEAYQTFAAGWSKEHQGKNFVHDRIVGMAVIIKKSIFNRIGGWDPDLPTNGRDGGYGFSDDDFSLRFRLAGYKSVVANDVFIHHFGSVTVSKYRPDLFGPAQNINKKKYLQKLRQNDRVAVGQHGELTLKPYGPDDHIPIAENTIMRPPRICIAENNTGVSETADRLNRYAALADSCQGEVVTIGGNLTKTRLIETIMKGDYDFIVLVDKRLVPSPEKLRALIDTALCYPDVAVMVPIGNYAPSTHAHKTKKGKNVEIIQYADLSLCVINSKLIRPLIKGLGQSGNDEDLFWFLQRRVRGEGYFIAKANDIIVDSDVPCINHPYDTHPLPEQLVQEKKYAEAIAIYEDDLIKDPTFVESLYQLACIAKENNQTVEAIKQVEHALRIDPHHIQSLIFLSGLFLGQGDLKRAEFVVRLANLKQPGNTEVQEVVAHYEQLKTKSGDSSKVLFKKKCNPATVSIIIPLSAHTIHFKKCIENIRKHTPVAHEVIFIDNGSKDGTVEWIRQTEKEKSNYSVIKTGKEAGQGECFNMGMEASSGEYIVLMRDHVLVADGWLEGMLRCINSTDDVGIVGPMTDNKAVGIQYVPGSDHIKIDQLEKYAGVFRERKLYRRIPSRHTAGFCMLFRRSLAGKTGLFDEELEQDSESDDYCLRAALAGYNNIIAGDVFVLCGDHYPKSSRRSFNHKWSGIDTKSHDGKRLAVLNAIEDAKKLCHREDIDKAVVRLIDGLKYCPDEKAIYHCLAGMLINSGRFKDALEAINSIPRDIGDNARTIVLTGYCKQGLELYEEAAQCADSALLLDSKSSSALNLKGIIAYRRGHAVDAEKFFGRAMEVDPGFGEPYTYIGVLRWVDGQKEKALNCMEKGFILTPAAKDMATIYHSAITKLKEFERAERVFREAKSLYPFHKRIALLLIDLLIQQGKNEGALQEIQKAMINFGIDDKILKAALEVRSRIDEQKTDIPAYKGKDYSLQGKKKLDKKAKDVQGPNERADLKPESPDEIYRGIHNMIGAIKPEEAISKFENLANSFPDFALAHNDLGVLHYNTGDKEKALNYYRQAVQIEPENIIFRKNLADFLYVESGRAEEALRIYVNILAANPDDVETLLITGHIFVALKKFDDAEDFYHRVLEIEPANQDATQNLEALQNFLATR